MENKLIFSLYDKKFKKINIETVVDIINLYGNKNIDGIEINSNDLEYIKKCAQLCKKNKMMFRCHFPLVDMTEIEITRYLNCLNDISKELRYNINIVLHSLCEQDTLEEKIDATNIYVDKLLKYIKKYKLNLTISLENLNYRGGIKRINISKIDEILTNFNELAFTYDIGHDLYDNKLPSNLSSLQISKINNVHIHSVLNDEDHHLINNKSNDLNEIVLALGKLRKAEYKGPIVLEYAIDYIEGNKIEEKIINYTKSFEYFKKELMK